MTTCSENDEVLLRRGRIIFFMKKAPNRFIMPVASGCSGVHEALYTRVQLSQGDPRWIRQVSSRRRSCTTSHFEILPAFLKGGSDLRALRKTASVD